MLHALCLLMVAYCAIALAVILLSMLYHSIFGELPYAKSSLAEVRKEAEALADWFDDTLVKNPGIECLGPGPELARQLVRLAGSPQLTREEARQFAERVRQELQGWKGSPFSALHLLARRLAELTDDHEKADT
jgi:hypothetical protein